MAEAASSPSPAEELAPVATAGDHGGSMDNSAGSSRRQQQHKGEPRRNAQKVSARRSRLRREHVHAPITALAFYDSAPSRSGGASRGRFLLAAEDTDLKIYDIAPSLARGVGYGPSVTEGRLGLSDTVDGGGGGGGGKLVGQVRVFQAQPIHGISVQYHTQLGGSGEKKGNTKSGGDDDRILIWGGDSVAVLRAGELLRDQDVRRTDISDGDADRRGNGTTARCENILVFKAPDWIFDAKISPFNRDRVVMLTAHNEIVEARFLTTTTTTTTTTTNAASESMILELLSVRSPSRPILYAGNILWLSPGCVLVAAGTVFGEVLVWKWHASGPDSLKEARGEEAWCEHLFAFSGHEGSIFGIQISPEIVVPSLNGRSARLLATCSDDRTVRIWDITDSQTPVDGAGVPRDGKAGVVPEARETGFGPNEDAARVADDAHGGRDEGSHDCSSKRCVAVAMGHISRIWHVEFAGPSKEMPGVFPIYSFGEDATTQKWHLSLGAQQQSMTGPGQKAAGTTISTLGEASLTHRAIFRNHTGKHIWSRAVMSSEDGIGVTIATGGSDGKIAVVHDENRNASDPGQSAWSQAFSIAHLTELSGVKPVLEYKPAVVEIVEPNEDTEGKKPKKKPKPPKESFQRYAFISESKLLVITNQGRCFMGSIGEQGINWKALPISEEKRMSLSGYTVVESCLSTSTVYIGTSRGELFALSEAAGEELRLVTTVQGKIADLFCLTPQSRDENLASGLRLMVTVLGAPTATILSIKGPDQVTDNVTVELEKGFIITAASLTEDTLILGSRNGVLSILTEDDSSSSFKSSTHSLPTKLADAITSIVPLPQRVGSTAHYFLTTCRDGKFRIYQRQANATTSTTMNMNMKSQAQESIILLQETSPPFGPLIEQAWFITNPVTNAHELMLCGFRSTNAVLWNATQQREVASIDCGGAHRSFAMTLLQRQSHRPSIEQAPSSSDGFRFVYTKASEMHVFSQTRSQAQALKPGSHGREIRAVSFSEKYTATAAEDTVIRIHEYTAPLLSSSLKALKTKGNVGGSFRCVATIEKHATGIQTLRWYKTSYLFSSGGNEEFFVWKVNQIDSDVCPLGVACEATFHDKSAIGDLRIMDFDVELLDDGGSQDCVGGDDGKGDLRFHITMALSNSTVQSYLYSTNTKEFNLLGRRHYTGACLMQLRNLSFSPPDESGQRQPHILTASTDGHLAIFVGLQADLGLEPLAPDEPADLPSHVGAEPPQPASDPSTTLITKIHQSGIKSLDVLKLEHPTSSSWSYLIVTGGDDNAIGITHLSFSLDTNTFTVRGKFIVRSAHAAAVTGIGIARLEPNGDGGVDAVVVSTSNDQRVKTWRVVDWQQGGKTRVLLEEDEYSGVADCGDLEIMRNDDDDGESDQHDGKGDGGGDSVKFLVGGVGVEVWCV